MTINKTTIIRALEASGFDHWQPKFDQRTVLDRPMHRPEGLPGTGRIASVLILVYPIASEPHIVFTRRHEDLSKHAGQISFPGGQIEPDEQPVQAAIREAYEEIGIEPNTIEVLGTLTSIYIPPSDFTVYPIVAWHPESPGFIAQETEVAEVIEISISHLLNPSTLDWGDIDIDEKTRHVPFYRWRHHQIWGATAIMLSELLERIATVQND